MHYVHTNNTDEMKVVSGTDTPGDLGIVKSDIANMNKCRY